MTVFCVSCNEKPVSIIRGRVIFTYACTLTGDAWSLVTNKKKKRSRQFKYNSKACQQGKTVAQDKLKEIEKRVERFLRQNVRS